MIRLNATTMMCLVGIVSCTVCFLGACTSRNEDAELKRFSLQIEEAIVKGIDRQGQSRVTSNIPPSFEGGVLCVAGPYALSPNDPSLIDMVGEEALEKMYGDGPMTNAEYLYHIDAEGEVDRVEIEWPVFIGTHYELRVVGGKVLVLLLDGNGLMGIDLQ